MRIALDDLDEAWAASKLRAPVRLAPVSTSTRRDRHAPSAQASDSASRAATVRFGLVLADAGYHCSATFRAGLSARRLFWAVRVPSNAKIYEADLKLMPAEPKPGRPFTFLLPDGTSEPAEAVLG